MTPLPMTANEVVMQLAKLGRELDDLVAAMDHREVVAVNAREDYTLALSTAFLRADGAMDLRKHQSIVDTHTERLAAELAEAEVRGTRRQIDSVKVRVDIGRSLGTTVRTEVALAGTGHTP